MRDPNKHRDKKGRLSIRESLGRVGYNVARKVSSTLTSLGKRTDPDRKQSTKQFNSSTSWYDDDVAKSHASGAKRKNPDREQSKDQSTSSTSSSDDDDDDDDGNSPVSDALRKLLDRGKFKDQCNSPTSSSDDFDNPPVSNARRKRLGREQSKGQPSPSASSDDFKSAPETDGFGRNMHLAYFPGESRLQSVIILRGQFDTYSQDNFVSLVCLQQANQIHELYEEENYREVAVSWCDSSVRICGEIVLRVAPLPGKNTYESENGEVYMSDRFETIPFYIMDDRSFDLVIGRKTIAELDLVRVRSPMRGNHGLLRAPTQISNAERFSVESNRAKEQELNDIAKQLDREKTKERQKQQALTAKQTGTSK